MRADSRVAEGAFRTVAVLSEICRTGVTWLTPESRLFLTNIDRLTRELERIAEIHFVRARDIVVVIACFGTQTHFDGLASSA